LPSDCPLVNHILLSYQKHHSPAQQPISEDKTNEDILEVVKPLNGIENNKFQPLIRKVVKGEVIITPSELSPAFKVCRNLITSYKNSLMNYIAGGSRENSIKREKSSTSKKHNKHSSSNADPVEEYNNFGDVKNSCSVASNKQPEENRSFKERHHSAVAEHTKSMGVGDESHDSLLIEEDAPLRNVEEKINNHSSFHKRPLSHNNVVRSKSSRQKRRKKTPVNGNKQQNTLISNTANTNSKATQDAADIDEAKSKKLIDDSKLGNKKSVVNASVRPKSSRGNRSFDSSGNGKIMGKTDTNFKQKRNSMAGGNKSNNNFGKKKNSYSQAAQFNADKLLAKYRQTRGSGGVSGSFSTSNIEQPTNKLVASIREKNSRNIEKFGEKGILGSNSIVELPENNSQYLISSDNIKGENKPQNMSFDVNHKQRILKPKKKKDEAAKALLNFEDMKRKILKDYVKKNTKELHSNVAQPSHHRNGGGLISNYLSQLDEYDKNKDARANSKIYSSKEKELLYLTEGMNSKKKQSKKAAKDKFSSIYEAPQSNHWTNNQPLTQKSINTNVVSTSKERPNSNKRHTPSKKTQPKTSSK